MSTNLSLEQSETVSFKTLNPFKYRPDIDGLRAIAVFAVLFFHAFPKMMKGGFVGVDVFFVISGFLISSIIFTHLVEEKFSFVEFYIRRIRRIFPSLLVILAVCFVAGWFVFLAEEFKLLGKHIAGGAGFIANFLYWQEVGYFDVDANTKPLRHLWSLGIEEQFYIVWPLLLWLAWKKRFNLLSVAVLLAMISFGFNLAKFQHNGATDFFSPQTRFWELLVGSILAYLMLFKGDIISALKARIDRCLCRIVYADNVRSDGRLLHNLLAILGFVMLITAIFITKEKNFPGIRVLLPVAGTVLLIAAGSEAWINKKVLSGKVLVWFGLISYPIYLWHWPLLSFARTLSNGTPDVALRVAIVPLSILLAWLTCKLIENPMRFGQHGKIRAAVLIILMTVTGSAGFLTFKYNGFPSRSFNVNSHFDEKIDGGGDGGMLVDGCGIEDEKIKSRFRTCKKDLREAPKFAVIGDSKSESLVTGLIRTSRSGGRWMIIGGLTEYGGPVPLIFEQKTLVKDRYRQFSDQTTIAIDLLVNNKNIETVAFVMATRSLFQLDTNRHIEGLSGNPDYEIVLDGLMRATGRVVKGGKRVLLVVDNPTLYEPRDCMKKKTGIAFVDDYFAAHQSDAGCSIPLARQLELSARYRYLLEEVKNRFPDKVDIFDMNSYLCDEKKGICEMSKNGKLLYSFSDHISDYASGIVGKEINEFLYKRNHP